MDKEYINITKNKSTYNRDKCSDSNLNYSYKLLATILSFSSIECHTVVANSASDITDCKDSQYHYT